MEFDGKYDFHDTGVEEKKPCRVELWNCLIKKNNKAKNKVIA